MFLRPSLEPVRAATAVALFAAALVLSPLASGSAHAADPVDPVICVFAGDEAFCVAIL